MSEISQLNGVGRNKKIAYKRPDNENKISMIDGDSCIFLAIANGLEKSERDEKKQSEVHLRLILLIHGVDQ